MSNPETSTAERAGVGVPRFVRRLRGRALIAYRKKLLAEIALHEGRMADEAIRLDSPDWPDAERDLLIAARRFRDAGDEHMRTIGKTMHEVYEPNDQDEKSPSK